MSSIKVDVSIKGISPLLMHAFPMVAVDSMEKKLPEQQCEICCYREPANGSAKGKLFVPAVNVQRALIAGAVYVKGKGRASLAKQAAACLFISPERLVLDNQSPIVDTRPVVVPATKGRVLRHRYRFDAWTIEFVLEYDDLLMKESEARRVVDESCLRVGFLDFRPERKGPFGRAMVTKWEAQD